MMKKMYNFLKNAKNIIKNTHHNNTLGSGMGDSKLYNFLFYDLYFILFILQ